MSRKVVLIPILAAAVVGVAVIAVAVWRQADAGPAIQTKALGVWQEQTAVDPIRMTISAADGQDQETQYWVTLPTSSKVPFPARLEEDTIVLWGENTQNAVWEITYDEGADVLLLARPTGTERHVLRRVSR